MTSRLLWRATAALVLMLLATVLAYTLKPDTHAVPQGEPVNLEALVPASFGAWRVDPSVVPVQANPEVVDKLAAIYDATLARTYINDAGERVMLSIAYGSDQTGRLRVHRPESCYTAQGFSVKTARTEALPINGGVEAKRLVATTGPRHEPITYWIRVGDSTVSGNIGQRLVQLSYGLTGEVPDGVIFRVSSIDRDAEAAYGKHDQFIAELNGAMSLEARQKLIGGAGVSPTRG